MNLIFLIIILNEIDTYELDLCIFVKNRPSARLVEYSIRIIYFVVSFLNYFYDSATTVGQAGNVKVPEIFKKLAAPLAQLSVTIGLKVTVVFEQTARSSFIAAQAAK